jgi:hypothetical protein
VIAVVHLVWGPLGIQPLRRFLESYRAEPAGSNHELVVLFNAVDRGARNQLLAELDGVEHRLIELEEPVQDLPAYAQASARIEHERLCFLNSHSVILAPGWLANLDRALSRPGVGLAGASGSWGSIRSYLRFSLGLGGRYAHIFEDRRTTIDTLEAIAERHRSTGAALQQQRKRFLLTYGRAVLEQAHGFVSFPAYHVRTTGFMVPRELFAELRIGDARRKNDAYRLESGRRSVTRQVQAQGLRALVVGRDGAVFEAPDWHASGTFWQRGQENLLIADKQTQGYALGDAYERRVLSRYAWGELAEPAPPPTS